LPGFIEFFSGSDVFDQNSDIKDKCIDEIMKKMNHPRRGK